VIYSKYAGTDLSVGDEAHVLLKVCDSCTRSHYRLIVTQVPRVIPAQSHIQATWGRAAAVRR
jgi:hypothetical protein